MWQPRPCQLHLVLTLQRGCAFRVGGDDPNFSKTATSLVSCFTFLFVVVVGCAGCLKQGERSCVCEMLNGV